jgi:hypothetical protein
MNVSGRNLTVDCVRALALDERRVWVHRDNLLGKRTIGTNLATGSKNGGKVEHFSDGGVSQYVAPILFWSEITNELKQAELVVDHQQHAVVFVDSLELERVT